MADRQSTNCARAEFCANLAALHHRAGQLGLFKTMQRLHDALKSVGYEVAEAIERDLAQSAPKENGESPESR